MGGCAPAHVRQPGTVGAEKQPLWPLPSIRVSPHATPQVCPQLPVTPTEQNQLCRLQGLIHPGPDWPSTHRISVLLTPPVAAVGLQFFYTSLPFVPKALRSPFGTQLYLRRQRLYYNMRN